MLRAQILHHKYEAERGTWKKARALSLKVHPHWHTPFSKATPQPPQAGPLTVDCVDHQSRHKGFATPNSVTSWGLVLHTWAFEGMLIWTMLPRDASSHLMWSMPSPPGSFLPLSQSPCSNFASFSSASGSVHLYLLLKSPTRERKKERGRQGGRGGHLISSRCSGLISYKAFLEQPFKQPPLWLPQHLTLEDLKSSFSLLASWLSTPAWMPSPHLPFSLPDPWQVQQNLMYKKWYLLNEWTLFYPE